MEECPDLKALRGYLTGGYAFNGNDADEIVAAMAERDALKLQNSEQQKELEFLRNSVKTCHDFCKDREAEVEARDRQNSEMRKALEIAKPSTIHVLSGHIYGTDDKLVEFVDGCARCRIERILEAK